MQTSVAMVRQFGTLKREMFKSPTHAESQRYHYGLFHGKKHSQRKKRCFSMKYRIETKKPNIQRKSLHSEILGQDFRLYISMKARRCIMKAGSLDNYLLNTKSKMIGSKFGLYLREQIKAKAKNPDYKMPYIPGTT